MSKYPGELDYLPGWDDRKTLAELWQRHCPLPAIEIARWGYKQRADEEPDALG